MKTSIKVDFIKHLWKRVVQGSGGSISQLPPHPLLVAFCAEPGMGCDEVTSHALRWAARLGARVLRRDLGASSQESATQFLTRLAKRVSQMEGAVMVGLDALPPSDEPHVARQARALRKMRSAGVHVVISLAPEGSQLLEALPECTVVHAPQLLVPVSRDAQDPEERGIARLTRGIPTLVRALGEVSLDTKGSPRPSSAYLDALARLFAGAVRPTLSDEECRIRLSMLLLGSGTSDDVARVADGCHADVLESIRASTPLFGISPDLTEFSCLASSDDQTLRACMRRLERACVLHPEVATTAMRVLASRGNYRRAAALGLLPERSDMCEVVLDRGVEFLDEGETELVRHTLSSPACPRDERSALLRSAMEALRGQRPEDDASPLAVRGYGPTRLFVEACSFLKGFTSPRVAPQADAEGLEGALRVHLEAATLMRGGQFAEALHRLAAESPVRRATTISGALLAVDAELARIMSGGAPCEEAVPVEARRLLSRPSLEGLSGYVLVEQLMEAALTGGADGDARAQTLVLQAERSGCALVQALSLIVGSALDLRGNSITRAHVRATLASSVAAGIDAGYLVRSAGLLKDVVRHLMGGGVEVAGDDGDDDLGRVCTFVRSLLLVDGATAIDDVPFGEVPRNALWLLRLLVPGMGQLSDSLARRLPPSWKRALGEGDARSIRMGEDPLATSSDAPLRLTLLGGFSLYVRGTLVPDWKIERRNAKSLLEYLVLRHGSETKRFRLVEQVWPDCDYVRGFSRAYQATSVLRRAIAEIEPGLDPFVASRTTREISLDRGMVSCDVDEFRCLARAATDSRDDGQTLELALRAERLYEGDLYQPSMDATGFIAGLRRELRDLCCDAFVAGSEAAERLGRVRTGVRLAREAVTIDDLREDAVVALVRALRACGRVVEADRQSAAFSARLARVSGRRGSRRLIDGTEGRGLAVAKGAQESA